MIGRLNHVAIAVRDIGKAAAFIATFSAPTFPPPCRSRTTA